MNLRRQLGETVALALTLAACAPTKTPPRAGDAVPADAAALRVAAATDAGADAQPPDGDAGEVAAPPASRPLPELASIARIVDAPDPTLAARLRDVVTLLARNRGIKPVVRLRGDFGEPVIPLVTKVMGEMTEVIATSLVSTDPEVRRLAAETVEKDIFGFRVRTEPDMELVVAEPLERRLLASLGTVGPAQEHAATELLLASVKAFTPWTRVLDGAPPPLLVALTRTILPLAPADRWRDLSSQALEGVFDASVRASTIEPIAQVLLRPRVRDFPGFEDGRGPLDALERVRLTPKDEPRVMAIVRANNDHHTPRILRRLRAEQAAASAFLEKELFDPRHKSDSGLVEELAGALAALPERGSQTRAAAAFTRLLAGRETFSIRAAAKAAADMTDAPAQSTLLAPLRAVALDARADQHARASAVFALGRMVDVDSQRKAVTTLVTMLADKDAWLRNAAGRAVGSLRDPAAQDVAADALVLQLGDRDGGVLIEAVRSLGQLRSAASRAKAQVGLRAKLAALTPADPRRSIVECAIGQLGGALPPEERCP